MCVGVFFSWLICWCTVIAAARVGIVDLAPDAVLRCCRCRCLVVVLTGALWESPQARRRNQTTTVATWRSRVNPSHRILLTLT